VHCARGFARRCVRLFQAVHKHGVHSCAWLCVMVMAVRVAVHFAVHVAVHVAVHMAMAVPRVAKLRQAGAGCACLCWTGFFPARLFVPVVTNSTSPMTPHALNPTCRRLCTNK
jgi:hypothetical protein